MNDHDNKLTPVEILGFVGMFGTAFVLILLGLSLLFNPLGVGEFLRTNFVPFFFETHTYGVLFILFQIIGFTVGYMSSNTPETTKKRVADGLCLQIFLVFFAGGLGAIWVWCFTFFSEDTHTTFWTIVSFTKAWVIANLVITLLLILIYTVNQMLSVIRHRWIEISLLLLSLFP